MDFRGRSSRSSGGSSGGSGSIDRSWTSQLSKAERDISLSSQRLENAFKENINRNDSLQQVGNANANANANGPHVVPNPIKMIRRLTALEIAIGQLGQDCETISEKRKNIVQSVIDDQNQNVAKTMQVIYIYILNFTMLIDSYSRVFHMTFNKSFNLLMTHTHTHTHTQLEFFFSLLQYYFIIFKS